MAVIALLCALSSFLIAILCNNYPTDVHVRRATFSARPSSIFTLPGSGGPILTTMQNVGDQKRFTPSVRLLTPSDFLAIKTSSTPAYIKIDPAGCTTTCEKLNTFWEMFASVNFPGRVWLLECIRHPEICIEIGAMFNVDVSGSLIEAWTGHEFVRFFGPKVLPALFVWLMNIDKELHRSLERQRRATEVDPALLPTLDGVKPVHAYEQPNDALNQLLTTGVLRLQEVLPSSATDALAGFVDSSLRSAKAAVERGEVKENHFFKPSFSWARHRYELKLQLGSSAAAALTHILAFLRPLYTEALGDDAELYELSALISEPGADGEAVHIRHNYGPGAGLANVVSAYVALHDVEPDMGPIIFMPRSGAVVDVAEQPSPEQSHAAPNELGGRQAALLRKGEMVLFDPGLQQYYSANRSGKRHALLVLSFKTRHEDAVITHYADEIVSLLPAVLQRAYTLADLTDPPDVGPDEPRLAVAAPTHAA